MQGLGYLRLERVIPWRSTPKPDVEKTASQNKCSVQSGSDAASQLLEELAELEIFDHEVRNCAPQATMHSGSAAHVYEYHVVYHVSYEVPVLMFQGRRPGASRLLPLSAATMSATTMFSTACIAQRRPLHKAPFGRFPVSMPWTCLHHIDYRILSREIAFGKSGGPSCGG